MNEQKHTMTGAWALNALDGEERERMRRHLAEDPDSAAEALSFEETAGELAGSLTPLAPRPELKAAVMARIATTRQLSPLAEEADEDAATADASTPEAGAGAAAGTSPGVPTAAAPGSTPDIPTAGAPDSTPGSTPGIAPDARSSADARPPAEVVPLDRYRASVRRSRWTAAAAAALLVSTVVGVSMWNSERLAEQEARASLEAIASAQEGAEQERAMLSEIMAADDAAHMILPSAEGGELQLMYSRQEQAMIVQSAGLPALPASETYQLWMIDGEDIVSAGMLEDPQESMMHDGALPDGVEIGLTIEPAGGSEQPTMKPIASGVL
ncbi:anti-sigma factor domain-containing protein [Brachybacterium saurashtrense]|uniref:Regulator of SigK n=1 Tax=Brachybacterium saurashtrense TaxID=556288 RepID=A0A345YRR6_9MICO|nr:anti-sigma factor [Brachybacterium saurashtrense]AXK46618.1 hypothetical protein DWV08_14015 [Brachybacterium saurashtrense]RRR20754.1 hypothetical protein DXU92_17040 [Brachybacterium saurashtrense]RRR24359.1 hypothetical protein DXU92_05765 [Brachybacterium saurashtrense]